MRSYAAIVPVKPPAVAKSRLVGPTADVRRELAAAFALDTVTACLSCTAVDVVLAVTDDVSFAARLADAGCVAIPDGVTGDLNASLRLAAAEAERRWPRLTPVAVCADLPALRPPDLAAALGSFPAGATAFVADRSGGGTTLYTAAYPAFDPRFGPGSRVAHRAAGAIELDGAPSLRQDVDDLADLRRALTLGVGAHTAALDIVEME